MKINSKAIKELAKLLDQTGLNEIEVAEGDQMIRVNKGMMIGGGAVMQAAPMNMPSDPTVPQAANNTPPAITASDHPGAVTSPMVGTAYNAPEPGAPTFVSKGGSINEGDTILIIEAKKGMNPNKATRRGTVHQVLYKNGTHVKTGDDSEKIE